MPCSFHHSQDQENIQSSGLTNLCDHESMADPSISDNASWDVIVVGSGANGGVAAMTLSEGGCRVLVIEAGRTSARSRPFPENSPTPSSGPASRVWEEQPRAVCRRTTES